MVDGLMSDELAEIEQRWVEWLIVEVKQLREARDRLKAEYDQSAAEVKRLRALLDADAAR